MATDTDIQEKAGNGLKGWLKGAFNTVKDGYHELKDDYHDIRDHVEEHGMDWDRTGRLATKGLIDGVTGVFEGTINTVEKGYNNLIRPAVYFGGGPVPGMGPILPEADFRIEEAFDAVKYRIPLTPGNPASTAEMMGINHMLQPQNKVDQLAYGAGEVTGATATATLLTAATASLVAPKLGVSAHTADKGLSYSGWARKGINFFKGNTQRVAAAGYLGGSMERSQSDRAQEQLVGPLEKPETAGERSAVSPYARAEYPGAPLLAENFKAAHDGLQTDPALGPDPTPYGPQATEESLEANKDPLDRTGAALQGPSNM